MMKAVLILCFFGYARGQCSHNNPCALTGKFLWIDVQDS